MTTLTTPAVLDRMARELPDHRALVTGDRVFTFAQLRQDARRGAAVLIALGVQPGDRVAIWSPNTWHWVIACLATHYAGAVVVPMNTGFAAAEAADVLSRSRARLLFAMDRYFGSDPVAGLDRAALPELRHIVRIPVSAGDPTWGDFLNGPAVPPSEVDARAAAVRPDDVADILFTSGTTGRSKGVMCAHRQSLSASAAAAAILGRSTADRYLCVVPLFHSFGYKNCILGCLQSGATLVVQRMFDPEQTMRLIAEQRVTLLPAPPVIFQTILDHPARGDHDLSSLRAASTGGDALTPALIERIRSELDIEAVGVGYGLTETNGYGTMHSVGRGEVATATCGRPSAGFELRIDTPDATGAGEVLLRGPNVMLGYLDDPEATAATIDADGWLHTGDVGTVDESGHLRITGRLKDMYICGGLNVYPAEVERVLTRLDGVADAAVIGVQHPILGEIGRAFVVKRPGAVVDEQTVIRHAREHLANFKTPRSVVFLDELPRNTGGKVLKSVLADIGYTPSTVRFTPQGLGGPPVGREENWIADLWQALLNIDQPGRQDRFVDLGGDSLTAAEFCRILDAHLGVRMSVDSLADRPTVAAVAAGLRLGGNHRRKLVVQLRNDDAGPVFLLIPGVGGHAWRFTVLAGALTGPCDVRGLSLITLRDCPPDQLRARISADVMAALQPEIAAGKPIILAGYSFGAMVAADLACRLLEHGVPVAKFILLDADPLDSADTGWDPRKSNTYSAPDSPEARQLEEEIIAMSDLLQKAYLDGSVRLPPTTVTWVQSVKMAEKYRSATTVFGTPVAQIPRTVLRVGHHNMMRIPQVHLLAPWLDEQLVIDTTTS